MNLKDFFLRQLAYNDAMNQTQLNKLKELENPPHETVELIAHIAKASILWLERLYGNSKVPRSYLQPWSLAETEEKLAENHKGWLAFLNEYDENGLNKVFEYTNIKGETYRDTLYDILFHVINHATHHRAQISKLLRQHEIVPPVMDYIAYARGK
jgi:uncharacterized damage-inducible protein DinB